jgi:benzodiazapine receptor
MARLKQFIKFIVALAICFGVSALGALFTTRHSLTDWYVQLNKPSFTPPNYIFGSVWAILYLLMAISVYLVWNKGLDKPGIRKALMYFAIQLALNAAWTPLFFGLHMICTAFLEILLLLLAVFKTMLVFNRISGRATLLLAPYFIWVSFAAILNGTICYMNR